VGKRQGLPRDAALQVTAQIFREAALRFAEATSRMEYGESVEDAFPAKCHDHCPTCPVRSSCSVYAKEILSPETKIYDPEDLGATAEAYDHFRTMENLAKTLKEEARKRLVTPLEDTQEVEGEKTTYIAQTTNGFKVSLSASAGRNISTEVILEAMEREPNLRDKLMTTLGVSAGKFDAVLKDKAVPAEIRELLKEGVTKTVGESRIDVRAIG